MLRGIAIFVLLEIQACGGRYVGVSERDGGAGSRPDASVTSCAPALEPVAVAATPIDGWLDTGAAFVALDERYVYFTVPGHGFVKRVPLCGGEVEVIAANRAVPLQIVDDDQYVYWTEGGTLADNGLLVRWSKTGGTAAAVLTDLRNPWAVAVDALAVYYGTYFGTWRWEKAGTTPVQLSNGTGYANLALDGSYVYWPAQRVLKSGGETQTLAAADSRQWCSAVDEQFLFWTEYTARVWRVEKVGGTAVPVLGDGPWRCLALDDQRVYVASDDGIYRVKKDGTMREQFAVIGGQGIALNDRDVYWAVDGGVFRRSK